MRLLAIASLTVATFVTSMVMGFSNANAVVCARGVYRAGCVGPYGGVVVGRPHYHPYAYYDPYTHPYYYPRYRYGY